MADVLYVCGSVIYCVWIFLAVFDDHGFYLDFCWNWTATRPMRVFITGDVHGDPIRRLNSTVFPTGKSLSEDDLVIIVGDFGVLWANNPNNQERFIERWLFDKPWTTLFLDGNHENHRRLDELPVENRFGADVGVVNDKLFHIKRGEVLTLRNEKFWCFGGAMSTDKEHRIVDLSWWSRELPSKQEEDHGLETLEAIDYKPDYILTHTMPSESVIAFNNLYGYHRDRVDDPVSRYLQHVYDNVEFKEWFCGHFHQHQVFNGVQCLYERIVEV